MLPPLNLPPVQLKFDKINGKEAIFDILRKKYVILTPEEWVRQHFLHFLIYSCGYPRTLMKVESGVRYNELTGRTDIIIYNRSGSVFMIVECKAADVKLTNQVFEQAGRYNLQLKARFLTLTNGLRHICCQIDHVNGQFTFLNELPSYE